LLDSARISRPAEGPWSQEVNGLRARVVLKRTHVFYGTPIISPFLELQNVSDVANPMKVRWTRQAMKLRVLDAQGRKLEEAPSAHSGGIIEKLDLILPCTSTLSFDASLGGLSVAGDSVGQLESWTFDRADKDYYLHAVLEIPEGDRNNDGSIPWDGKIEIPPVLVPLRPDKFDSAKLGPVIQSLGNMMVGADGNVSEKATRALSLLDDPRVIPWYVKAMDTRDYELVLSALERLAMFNSDAALEGIKKGMQQRKGERYNDAFRQSAAEALSRSPSSNSKKLLLTLWDDPYREVRFIVAEALGKMKDGESLSLLKKMCRDSDKGVLEQALESLELRGEKP
jgi:hypothetical protein